MIIFSTFFFFSLSSSITGWTVVASLPKPLKIFLPPWGSTRPWQSFIWPTTPWATLVSGCCHYTSSKLIKCCLIWVKWEQLKRLDSNLLLKLMESWTIGKQRWGKPSTWGQSRDSYPPHELGYFLCQRGILVNYEILIHLPHLKYPRAEDNGTENNLNRII